MNGYVFKRKLIVTLCTSIFVPTLLICILLGYYSINKKNKELEAALVETEMSYKSAFREVYKDYDTLVKSIINYNTLNELLSVNQIMQLDKMQDYSYELGTVLDSIMAPLQDVELTIYTQNSNVPEIKYIEKIEGEMHSQYEDLEINDNIILKFTMRGEDPYLYILYKYKLTANRHGRYHVIEFRVPVSTIIPSYQSEGEVFTVYEDADREFLVPICSDKEEALVMYEEYRINYKKLHLACTTYEMDYFDGNFYVFMDKQSYMEVVGRIIVIIIGVFLVFAACIIWIANYTTQHLTKRLVDIVSAIRHDGMSVLNCNEEAGCDEFDVIESEISRLVQDLKRENDKVLKLELESLNYRIAPHFIYNNLSVIKWKCNDSSIDDIIDCLVLYYRNVFQKNSAFTTVEEEVENLSNYIKLLQFAYEDDFCYQTNIDSELSMYKIPSNIIQPLIENAFFHGINNITDRKGRIKLEIFKENQCVIIEVWDNGNKEEGVQKKAESSTTVIDRRIKLYYSSSYGLRRFSRDDFTIARIEMPFIEETE